MTKVLVNEDYLGDIANAIRAKNGGSDTYTPGQMAGAIENIPTGGITPTGTKQITQNGTHDVTQYASANVNVPNSYAAGDEGKVVQNGALVTQTSQSVTVNGTYDTTTNDEVVVNVPSAGGTIYCHQCILSSGSDRAAISIATDSSDSFTLDSLIEWLSDHGYNSSSNTYPAYGLLNGSSSNNNTVIKAYFDGSYVRLISKNGGNSGSDWSVTDTVVQN